MTRHGVVRSQLARVRNCVQLLSCLILFAAPETTCSDLSEVVNGRISYNSGSSNRRSVNTVATYSCNSGFSLKGGEKRTCEVDSDWSGTAPTCIGEPNSHSTVNTCTSLFLVIQQKIHAPTCQCQLMEV